MCWPVLAVGDLDDTRPRCADSGGVGQCRAQGLGFAGSCAGLLPGSNLATLRGRRSPWHHGGVVDRATIEITNHTGQTVYFRVSGWKPDQFETCRALGEVEVVRGPLGPGDTERVMVDAGWQGAGVSVTVAFWDGPCGEACAREPIRSMVVPLSPVEPAAT